MRGLKFLRAKLIAVIVVLLVLGGYGAQAFGCCEEPSAVSQTEPGHAGHPAHTGDACQCLCHQTFLNDRSTPPPVPIALFEVVSFVSDGADFPPDAIPLGIDHPPQLA